MVLPDSDGISRVPPYSGSTLEGNGFGLQDFYLVSWAFPDRFAYDPLFLLHVRRPTTPIGKPLGLGYVPFRSPLLRKSHLLSLPPGT